MSLPSPTGLLLAALLLLAMSRSLLAIDADVAAPGRDKQWIGKHNYLAALAAQASRKPPSDIYLVGDTDTSFFF